MKKAIIAFAILVCSTILTACVGLTDLLPVVKSVGENVKVVSVSAEKGITVNVKGVDCTFQFTTEREVILAEVQKCLLGDAESEGLLFAKTSTPLLTGATSAPVIVGSAPVPTPAEPPEVVLVEEPTQEALELTDDILDSIRQLE